jgi:hypothetical protein
LGEDLGARVVDVQSDAVLYMTFLVRWTSYYSTIYSLVITGSFKLVTRLFGFTFKFQLTPKV